MTSDFERFSIPDCIHYIYFPILILEKEPVFSLLVIVERCNVFLPRVLYKRCIWQPVLMTVEVQGSSPHRRY